MSIIHIQRIKNALEKLFVNNIDMSDYNDKLEEEKHRALLSRSVAAYCLIVMTDIDPIQAGKSVTDGFNDNGIDTIYFDRAENLLYVVQSKWIDNGKGSINQEDSKKFLDGFRDLITLKLNRFNNHIQKREKELREALYNSSVKFVLIMAHTGTGNTSSHVQGDIDNLLNEMNTPDEVVSVEIFDQSRLYEAIAGQAQRKSINLEIMLHEWGYVEEPYRAYYGQVDAINIAEWWKIHGRNLFVRNIRNYKGATDVNLSLAKTLRTEPRNFWYFNNGITILCSKINKKPLGGNTRNSGIFDCEGITVVNGAQTVGVIGYLCEKLKQVVDETKVLIRLISLENCPLGFDQSVTRATNTQNRIERRDFASLDHNQQRLASELLLDEVYYAYKSGDEDAEIKNKNKCSIVDSTFALACAENDVAFSVQAKREIGRLWEDIEQPPYTVLFNESRTGSEVWRAVQIMRIVENILKGFIETLPLREGMIAVHGNRLILHCVFMEPGIKAFRDTQKNFEDIKQLVHTTTENVFKEMRKIVEARYENSYLATLFKNLNKCRIISNEVISLLYDIEGSTNQKVEKKSDETMYFKFPDLQ